MNKIFQNKNYFIKKKNRHVSCAYTGSYIALHSILSRTNNRSRIWKKMPDRHFFFPHKNQLLFFPTQKSVHFCVGKKINSKVDFCGEIVFTKITTKK